MRYKQSEHPIAALVTSRIESEGITLSMLAAELGISQSYLTELLLGDKPFSGLRRESVRALAAWLELPAVRLFRLSGLLVPEDYFVEGREQDGDVEQALRRVAASSYAMDAGVDDTMLIGLPAQVRQLLVLVFNDVENRP